MIKVIINNYSSNILELVYVLYLRFHTVFRHLSFTNLFLNNSKYWKFKKEVVLILSFELCFYIFYILTIFKKSAVSWNLYTTQTIYTYLILCLFISFSVHFNNIFLWILVLKYSYYTFIIQIVNSNIFNK